ncbi:oxalate decarboxylase [Dichomitus squalens LYAD-421 SS1]|uniref:oxalate decarboxylase n=1 Tax=Dichomitus squalens (strain LYAD-421) TaxID=732165 RepID=UPI000441169C|nr:oxalate decarboxylase [Dichomitus squalens LYAD-421 SS1]EJF64520.1 oxalate decarboxylase [Dichomitus squalens LYAD-421 SS1]
MLRSTSSKLSRKLLPALLLSFALAPTYGSPTPASQASEPAPTVPYASENPNLELWSASSSIIPEAIRDSLGATVLGAQNIPLELQNPDLLAPPTTDHGDVPNAKWPFDLSHNRLQTGGWARQQNVNAMPIAKGLAGVDMRLEKGAIRSPTPHSELHWHNTAEWAYVLKGTAQISTVNTDGQNYVKDVTQGSLWYFPPGQPHSIQATGEDDAGVEFLLVFNSGTFNEDDTFLLTDWLAHTPKEVLAKNFHVSQAAFDRIPSKELYIFPGTPPANEDAPASPYGETPEPFTFDFANVVPTQHPGGTVKIADSRNFKVSTQIAAAEVSIEPSAMRELHWHPSDDEWTYILEGSARITLFAASGNARTFDYEAGDIAYIPASYGHYIENTGNGQLRLLEILKTDVFKDISLMQWLALTPPELVKAHLGVSDETIAQFSKEEQLVVAPFP